MVTRSSHASVPAASGAAATSTWTSSSAGSPPRPSPPLAAASAAASAALASVSASASASPASSLAADWCPPRRLRRPRCAAWTHVAALAFSASRLFRRCACPRCVACMRVADHSCCAISSALRGCTVTVAVAAAAASRAAAAASASAAVSAVGASVACGFRDPCRTCRPRMPACTRVAALASSPSAASAVTVASRRAELRCAGGSGAPIGGTGGSALLSMPGALELRAASPLACSTPSTPVLGCSSAH